MHSLPSRRRLSQPIFFRFKCRRLSPVPAPALVPPPALPRLSPLSRLLPAAPQRPLPTRAPAPVTPRALVRGPLAAQAGPRARGTAERPAGSRQGRGALRQSANTNSVTPPPHPLPHSQGPTVTSLSRPLSSLLVRLFFSSCGSSRPAPERPVLGSTQWALGGSGVRGVSGIAYERSVSPRCGISAPLAPSAGHKVSAPYLGLLTDRFHT